MMYRDPNLLAMARDKECLLTIPGICNGRTDTTVAAHSNLGIHGKGRSLKAHDAYSVQACSSCHTWLDQGPASKEEKSDAFYAALVTQVLKWGEIAHSITAKPRDVKSAQAALKFIAQEVTNE